MKPRSFRELLLLVTFLITASGCAGLIVGAGASVGTYAYVKGNLNRNYEAPIDRVWKASLAAVQELKLAIESKQHDAFSGVIKGKMADGKSYEIKLKRISDNLTDVGIRVGTFGDKIKSEAIHDKILSKL